jgi:hypothetical protein
MFMQGRSPIRWFSRIVLIPIALAIGCQTKPEGEVALRAQVLRVKGGARCSYDGAHWNTLKRGNFLHAGCVVQTATDSAIDIVLVEGYHQSVSPSDYFKRRDWFTPEGDRIPADDIIRLYGDTILSIDRFVLRRSNDPGSSTKAVSMHLRTGRVIGGFNKELGCTCDVWVKDEDVYIINALFGITDARLVGVKAGVVLIIKSGVILNPRLVIPAGKQYDPKLNQVTDLPLILDF